MSMSDRRICVAASPKYSVTERGLISLSESCSRSMAFCKTSSVCSHLRNLGNLEAFSWSIAATGRRNAGSKHPGPIRPPGGNPADIEVVWCRRPPLRSPALAMSQNRPHRNTAPPSWKQAAHSEKAGETDIQRKEISVSSRPLSRGCWFSASIDEVTDEHLGPPPFSKTTTSWKTGLWGS